MKGLLICAIGGLVALVCVGQDADTRPEWNSIKVNREGRIELAFQIQPKQEYVIEASVNLSDWKAVSEPFSHDVPTSSWTAPQSTVSHRFFRLAKYDRDWMRSQFERNRRLWDDLKMDDYTFQFRWSCFCLPEYTAPVDIHVELDTFVSVSLAENGNPVAPDNWDRYETIDRLFDILEDAFDQNAEHIQVSYDPELGYPLSAFIDYSTFIADEERGFEAQLQADIPIVLSTQSQESFQRDPFRLLGARINGDGLEIQVEYGGGCRIHAFQITAHPSTFLESEPIQVDVHVSHQSNDDLCKALIRERRTFSLKPLKEAFQEIYPSRVQLMLNVHGFKGLDSETVQRVLFSFPD